MCIEIDLIYFHHQIHESVSLKYNFALMVTRMFPRGSKNFNKWCQIFGFPDDATVGAVIGKHGTIAHVHVHIVTTTLMERLYSVLNMLS